MEEARRAETPQAQIEEAVGENYQELRRVKVKWIQRVEKR